MKQEKVWDAIAKSWEERKKIVFLPVEKFLKNKKGKILDLGCGSGRNFPAIKGKIYGTDISQNMLNIAKEKFPNAILKKSPANKIPFDDNFFDSAIFIAVLHCINSKKERGQALKELFRVLKPSAEAMIAVWGKNERRINGRTGAITVNWGTNKTKYTRKQYIFTKEELENLLEETGFRIKEIHEDKNLVAIVKKPISKNRKV